MVVASEVILAPNKQDLSGSYGALVILLAATVLVRVRPVGRGRLTDPLVPFLWRGAVLLWHGCPGVPLTST